MTSEQAKHLASLRKTHAGKPKKLEECSHCGQMLGVRDRRKHGDRRIGGSLAVRKTDNEKG